MFSHNCSSLWEKDVFLLFIQWLCTGLVSTSQGIWWHYCTVPMFCSHQPHSDSNYQLKIACLITNVITGTIWPFPNIKMILLNISKDFGLPSFTKNSPGCRSAGSTLCRARSWTAVTSFQLWIFSDSMIRNYSAHRKNPYTALHVFMSVTIIFTPSPARKP